jgi:putative redox protein
MHITLDRLNDAYHFRATNDEGCTVDIDASPAIGGGKNGVRPMQLMLMSLGGCSGIDVVNILTKQKQELHAFHISIDGVREPDVTPSLFKDVAIHFHLEGNIDPAKARRAVALSVETYCSAAATLRQSAEINYRVSLNGEELK